MRTHVTLHPHRATLDWWNLRERERDPIVNPDDLACRELVELVMDHVEDRLSPSVRTRFARPAGPGSSRSCSSRAASNGTAPLDTYVQETSMKAIGVIPGKKNSVHLTELPKPSVSDVPNGCGVLVRVLRVGVDGTDREINEGCLGNVSEILEPEPPYRPVGAPAQAWSVAEILSVLRMELGLDLPPPAKRGEGRGEGQDHRTPTLSPSLSLPGRGEWHG